MSLNTNALCTLEELKSFIGVDTIDASKDIIYSMYINAVSNQIEKLIGRKILAKDYTEKYKGTDSTELLLKNYPVNSITSVKYICDGQEYMDLDSYDYDLDEESGILYKDDGWLLQGYSSYMSNKIDYPRRHIKVEYNGGFTEVPPDLKLLCLKYISDSIPFNTGTVDGTNGPGILKSYSISDVRLDFRDEIKFSSEDMKVISSYKGVHF
ncbi:phage gp6-like head-tail connector protein [Clostridium magnum]|uniref:phage gp6-like head-tail connector protein n=1 Tax=Clostridium magnum TaxID=33954 RepID=UPI0009207484|nr:phage gp6-like head-tail connector protein [Clostridium magnum]SHJ29218.1 phage conserved hypothetical protein, phiE125 gp8 family [Clostridium magnum DSM 2767]